MKQSHVVSTRRRQVWFKTRFALRCRHVVWGCFHMIFGREPIRVDSTADTFGSFPCGNASLPHDNKPFPHGFDAFSYHFNRATIGFRPSTIAFVLKTSDLKALQYCSAPDSCVLAADPSFFAPDQCGSGVEKTVHEVWTVHFQLRPASGRVFYEGDPLVSFAASREPGSGARASRPA